MRKWALILSLFVANGAFAQINESRYFVAYEILEMAMNNFQYLAGEIGYRFDQKNQIRLTIMEVKLTERHLSSKWEAAAVDGEGVKGYFRGYEMHYDRFFAKHWYISADLGYYNDNYEHTKLDEDVQNKTLTIGSVVSPSFVSSK